MFRGFFKMSPNIDTHAHYHGNDNNLRDDSKKYWVNIHNLFRGPGLRALMKTGVNKYKNNYQHHSANKVNNQKSLVNIRNIHSLFILLTKIILNIKQKKLSINPNNSTNRLFVSIPKNDLATNEANKTSPIAIKTSAIFSNWLSVKYPINLSITFSQHGFLKLSKKALVSYLIVSTVIVGTGLIYLFGPWTKKTEAAWFNDNWAYRQEVPVTSTNGSAQSNVFVSFSLDTATLITAGKLQSSCQDIRVTDQGGNILPYHIGRTNACNLSNTTIDFLLTSFPDLKSTYYVYYGNPQAVSRDVGSNFSQSEASNYSVGSLGSEAKAPSPTLYWKFDDGTIGTAEDSTTNGLDGTHNNTPTIQTEDFCISAKCLYFDGANNENVSLADNAKLDFAATDNFTIQAWVKRNGASSAVNYIITKAQSGYTGYKLYQDASGDYCFDVKDGTNTDTACTSAVEFDDDKWHLVQGVKIGTTSITLFVDGKQRAQDASIAATLTLANTGTFYAGVDLDGTSNEWLGFIDEVKVYSYQRSAAQILADFNARSNNEGASAQFSRAVNNNPGALNNGLVGYWKMDERTSISRTDSSGNGSTLTDVNTVAAENGKYGNGGDFELDNSEYVFVADNSILSLTGSLTLAAWIRPETVSAGSYNILGKWDGASESYRLFQNGDEIRLELESANNYIETSDSSLVVSTWYHVVGVYNASSATAKIYINGTEATSTTTGTIPSSITNDTDRFQIGAEDSTGGAANFYDGNIDEVRVYNRALSGAEVSQLYNFATGPIGYWKLDEKSGSSAVDSSGYVNTGSWSGTGSHYTNGKFGASGNFNGSDDAIDVGDLTLLEGTGQVSWSFWIKPTTLSTDDCIFCKANWSSATNRSFALMTGASDSSVFRVVLFQVATNAFTTDYAETPSGVLVNGTWTHIEVAWDNTLSTAADRLKVYVNGIPQTLSITGANTADFRGTGTNAIMGSFADSAAGTFLNGVMDDVKVYNYDRTSGQVIEDMNAGHPAPGSPVGSAVGYWKFDEGYSTTVNDSSGQNGSENLVMSAATNWTNSGKFGKAFNGATNVRASMAADDNDLDFVSGEDISISLWFKSDSATNPSANEYLVEKGASVGTAAIGYAIYTSSSSDGLICFGIDDDAVTNFPEDSVCSASDFYDATWHHILAKKTASSRLDLYVDGKPNGTPDTSISATGSLDTGSVFRVGDANATDGTDEFLGDLDEVKVFRFALTDSQVQVEYNRGSSQIMGALGDNSNFQVNAAGQEYCIPGDSSTCTAPVGRWDMEEKAVNGGTVLDTSTNDKTATFTRGTGGTVKGKIGSAYNFDSASTKIQTSSTYAAPTILTIEAWIYPRSMGAGNQGRIVSFGTGQPRFAVQSTNTLRFVYPFSGSPALYSCQSATNSISLNTWQHVVVIYDSSSTTNEATFYINDIPSVCSTTDPGGSANPSTVAWVIGNDTDDGDTFDGYIDQVRVYNYIRSPAQIAWDYNRGGPVAHWKMDECQGTAINDSSGNSNTGTITVATGNALGTCTTSSTFWGGSGGTGAGKRNYAPTFDGTDDLVRFSYNSGINNQSSVTVAAWIKTSSASGNQMIYSTYDGTSGSCCGFQILNSVGNAALWSDSGLVVSSSVNVSDGNWHYIVGVWDGTNSYIYVDGIQRTSAARTITAQNSGKESQIGAECSGASSTTCDSFFNGQIDDARVYNYPLTATQVKTLYTGGALNFAPVTGAP